MIQVTYYGLPVHPVPFGIGTAKLADVRMPRRSGGAISVACSSAGHLGTVIDVQRAASEEGADVEILGWVYSIRNLIGSGVRYTWVMRDGTLSRDLHAESSHVHFDDALRGLMSAYQSPQSHGIHLAKGAKGRLEKVG